MDGIPFIFCYMDNLLIYFPCLRSHEEAVKTVLGRLRKYSLIYNPLKLKFFHTSINFLGHHIDKDGINPIEQNNTRIINFTTPMDKPSLKRFLGFINYYRTFVPGLANMAKLLMDMTSPKLAFNWTKEYNDA